MIVAIIDSGIYKEHKFFSDNIKIIDAIHFFKNSEGEIINNNNIIDDVGHGTSVTSIIYRFCPQIEFVIVKIFDNEIETDENLLITALEYLLENHNCDVINISGGISRCNNISLLQDLCNKLVNQGSIIVSAFDNDGGLSYPAALKNVVGVDWSLSCFSQREFYYIEGSPINIRGIGYSQILPVSDGGYKKQAGSSFVAPIITGIICEAKNNGEVFKNEFDLLRKKSKEVIPGHNNRFPRKLSISKAIVISLTKETLCLFENSSMLPFSIHQICDFGHSGKIGKEIGQFLRDNCETNEIIRTMKIETINDIRWSDDFDTVIIGHTNLIERASRTIHIKKELIEKSIVFNKQVYMFDSVGISDDDLISYRKRGAKIRVPVINRYDVIQNSFGKLFQLNTPVLGVFGTSPKQGKYTIQLRLREYLNSIGYKASNFGTEPSCELFGFEGIYPIGYNSTVNISGGMSITYINAIMQKIELENPDIIIVGSQSQTIQTSCESLGYMTYSQHELILGTQPDAYLLCVNVNDDLHYIKKTIEYLQSVTESSVICIIVFPVKYKNDNGYLKEIDEIVEEKYISDFIIKINEEVGINAVSMNDEHLMKKIKNIIECFFR